MAAASSAHYFGLGEPQMQQQQQQQQQQPPLQNNAAAPVAATPAPKKKRNQPGNPNPDAEVIALSPHTLLATNRFVCEVCNKGFQREQNLQLHRRGHNLPWKLKQKNPKETRRRVYLCPEPSCVHHDPSRALGDLTGIKKHYSRKHGEKKWKCDKCNKRYAVQSDWKAHSKTCGTREYRCDCGTLFSRRDSFITHRAFCDALAQESGRMPPMGAALYGAAAGMAIGGLTGMAASQLQSFQDHSHHSSAISSAAKAVAQFDHLMATSSAAGSPAFRAAQPTSSSSSPFYLGGGADDGQTHTSLLHGKPAFHGLMQLPEQHYQQGSNGGGLLNLSYFSGGNGGHHQEGRLVFQDQFNGVAAGNGRAGSGEHGNSGNNADSASIFSGNMMGGGGGGGFSSLYNSSDQTVTPPQMSATALLQKAAQMGATTSSGGGGSVNSLLRGLGSGGGALNSKPAGAAAFIMSGESSSRSTSQTAENESQLRELMMNTLSATGSGAAGTVFVGGGGFPGVDDGKLSTRDFLGVSGGAPGLQLRHGAAAGMGMAGSLDQEMK